MMWFSDRIFVLLYYLYVSCCQREKPPNQFGNHFRFNGIGRHMYQTTTAHAQCPTPNIKWLIFKPLSTIYTLTQFIISFITVAYALITIIMMIIVIQLKTQKREKSWILLRQYHCRCELCELWKPMNDINFVLKIPLSKTKHIVIYDVYCEYWILYKRLTCIGIHTEYRSIENWMTNTNHQRILHTLTHLVSIYHGRFFISTQSDVEKPKLI